MDRVSAEKDTLSKLHTVARNLTARQNQHSATTQGITPMPITLIVIIAGTAGLLLILAALAMPHAPRATTTPPESAIRPIQPDTPAPRRTPAIPLHQRLQRAIANHPDPLVATLKTAVWIALLVALVEHLTDRRYSITAHAAWVLTIAPHEAGHFICQPFGWLLMVLGGSIWQILIYVLAGLYALYKRKIDAALLMWAIVGHSFINVSVYIGDAAERKLPLIFGMSKEYHDWWNILKHYDALEHDDRLAIAAVVIGTLIALSASTTGILVAWWKPRSMLENDPIYAEGMRDAAREEIGDMFR